MRKGQPGLNTRWAHNLKCCMFTILQKDLAFKMVKVITFENGFMFFANLDLFCEC